MVRGYKQKENGGEGRDNLNNTRYENNRYFTNKVEISEDFSLLHSTHIDSGTLPASYTIDTGGKATEA
jgi:hypothetical protein